jgi:UDP-2-acetamido-2,6-beta-L-arabino-hexul-4-ose reductase
MLKVGITGQAGFVGTHLYNTLGLFPERFQRISFNDSYFETDKLLEDFVSRCDVVIHLAAMNRHNDPQILYNTNIKLVRQVINACVSTGTTPHILFSSSTQEERDNLYGISKKEGRKLFEEWALKNKACFSGLIIPNVFGPFGHPYYNSVVATFCYQLSHDEIPRIDNDSRIRLIYVGELVNHIISIIEEVNQIKSESAIVQQKEIPYSSEINVSGLLNLLKGYKSIYYDKGQIPDIAGHFEKNLFNTFVSYIDHAKFFPFKLDKKSDARGSFVELIKLSSGGQLSFSITLPGITRGNHFHIRKAERFAVIKGKAKIEIRRVGTEKILSFNLDGDQPSFVDMPVWHTHNITNTGTEDLYTIFWISEHYAPEDPDTYFENV